MGGEAATPTSGAEGQNRPRETAAKRRFRDRDEFGPLGAFLRLERRREARVSHQPSRQRSRPEGRGVVLDSTSSTPRRENAAGCGASLAAAESGEKCGLGRGHPDEWREENAARGPESARSKREGGAASLNAARRRAKGAQRARSMAPTRACSRRNVGRGRVAAVEDRGRRASGHGDGDGHRNGARLLPRPALVSGGSLRYRVNSLIAPLKLSREMLGPPGPVLKLSSLPGVYLLVLCGSGPISLVIEPEKVVNS